MQTKTIKKHIINKLNDWFESITDKELVKLLKKDTIVTGGCITSLFLNDKVNDYDVYIKTKSTLLALIHYYTDSKNITILDGEFKQQYISNIEKDYRHVGDTIIDIQSGYACVLRNLEENQVKLYFDLKPGKKYDIDPTSTDKYQVSYLSPNAITLTDNLQIVIRFYGNTNEIHLNYDFIHATNYFTFDEGLVTNVKALECILTKTIKYQGSRYPVTSIIRTKKFISRGWTCTAGELFKMIYQASLLDLNNPDILEEQLIGVDVAYFFALIQALRNIKEEKLTIPYMFELIDRIFNNDDTDGTNNE